MIIKVERKGCELNIRGDEEEMAALRRACQEALGKTYGPVHDKFTYSERQKMALTIVSKAAGNTKVGTIVTGNECVSEKPFFEGD